jgi:casein kinase II subunit beta
MSITSSQSPESWISSFCSLVGHEYFAEVSEDFIEDDFNLTGLQSQVPMYKDALEMILDVEPSETGSSGISDEEEEEEDDGLLGEEQDEPRPRRTSPETRRHMRANSDASVIESSAELLYGLIHARFITSRPGIQQMLEKYEIGHFGHCPRVFCSSAKVLPVGRTDTPGQETVKLFCPSCLDIYTPPNSRFQAVDGAFFGTTFGCLFFMTFPDLDLSPQRQRHRTEEESAQQNNTDTVTASRSSSLTLPSAPGVPPTPQYPTRKEEPIVLPEQPSTINGMATSNVAPGLGKGRIYEPRIYGFRVSERAKSGPRMKWLRSKPLDINELDESRIWHAKYGGDPDGDEVTMDEAAEGDAEDAVMGSVGQSQQAGAAIEGAHTANQKAAAVAARRKAPMRRSKGKGRASEGADGGGG